MKPRVVRYRNAKLAMEKESADWADFYEPGLTKDLDVLDSCIEHPEAPVSKDAMERARSIIWALLQWKAAAEVYQEEMESLAVEHVVKEPKWRRSK